MNIGRSLAAPLALTAGMSLTACFSARHPDTAQSGSTVPARAAPAPGPDLPPATGDAVPRVEPRSRHGNPESYVVFGKRYHVLSSSTAYVERGVASWYGPGFHQVRTSTGEPYDMYGMSAAHRTLPLPAYARVTNLQNGYSVVVRINDRGPFVGNRIIDMSYAAARKLDMLRNGTAMVEVRALDPSVPQQVPVAPPPAPASTFFLQAGAFAESANAEQFAVKLRAGPYGKISIHDDLIAGRKLYRVRVGPVSSVAEFDRIAAALEKAGVRDARLAMD